MGSVDAFVCSTNGTTLGKQFLTMVLPKVFLATTEKPETVVAISTEGIYIGTFIAKQIYGERMILDVWSTSGPAGGFTKEHV